jgi:hypothetical protein
MSREVKADVFYKKVGVYLDESELVYPHERIVEICIARLNVVCPVCEAAMNNSNCACCRGKGQLTMIEKEKYERLLLQQKNEPVMTLGLAASA